MKIILSEGQFNKLLLKEYAGVTDYMLPLAKLIFQKVSEYLDNYSDYEEYEKVFSANATIINGKEVEFLETVFLDEVEDFKLPTKLEFIRKSQVNLCISNGVKAKASYDYHQMINSSLLTVSAPLYFHYKEQNRLEVIYRAIVHELTHLVNMLGSNGNLKHNTYVNAYQQLSKSHSKTAYYISYYFTDTEMNARLNEWAVYYAQWVMSHPNECSQGFEETYSQCWVAMDEVTLVNHMKYWAETLGYNNDADRFSVVSELMSELPQIFGERESKNITDDNFDFYTNKLETILKKKHHQYKKRIDKMMYLIYCKYNNGE